MGLWKDAAVNILTGKFEFAEDHHKGWFRVFKFSTMIEIWFGKRWIEIEWKRDKNARRV